MGQGKVLIVDDSPESINILAASLPDNIRVQIALDGNSALRLLEKSEDIPDVILLDVMMPGMNGYEFCVKIKSDNRLKDIPVIFLSANTELDSKLEAFSKGGVDYITKPFEREEVLSRMSLHLKQFRVKKELENHNKRLEDIISKKTKDIIQAKVATVNALIKLEDTRDDTTGLHVIESKNLCKLLAKKIKEKGYYEDILTKDYIEILYNASPLHDIGKITIPDYILQKPGKLTYDEFEIMKTHTTQGADYLQSILDDCPDNDVLKMGVEIARYHHEKWDGTGYPEALRGIDIPLSARIMAIADVYNALMSKRPYKDALSHQESINIIKNGRGTHFDPIVVEAFLEMDDLCDEKKDGS